MKASEILVSMEKASEIMRRSIFTFLQSIHLFSSTPAFLALPFAVAVFLSQSFVSSSSLFLVVEARLHSLFVVSGFPPSLELFTILTLKLSQTFLAYLLVLPFTLSFLLLAKASTILALQSSKQLQGNTLFYSICSFINLLVTQICTSLVLLAANATCLCILVLCCNFVELFALSSPKLHLLVSAAGTILYSVVFTNTCIICNLSLIISWMEKRGGFNSILKACFLIQDRSSVAMALVVPINICLAAIDALFQYRVARASQRSKPAVIMEGILISYLYSMLLVLDTIVSFMFLKSCKQDHQEEPYSQRIEISIRGKDGKVDIKLSV